MTSVHSQLLAWIEDGTIRSECIQPALKVSGITPDASRWRRFLDQLLLALGSLSMACAIVFLVAYNWTSLSYFLQFAVVQLLMVIAIFLYWKLGPDKTTAKVALLVAAILLGALLALFGQTYQTGADSWQMFAAWAALMLPWALIGRFAPLWLMWLALLNVTITLYYEANFGLLGIAFATKDDLLWVLLVLNTGALLSWELASRRFHRLAEDWRGRWPARLIAMASGFTITALVLRGIFDPDSMHAVAWAVYFAWLMLTYYIYRRKLPDLFMLANASVTLITCITSLFADIMLQGSQNSLSFLLLALIIVAQAAFAAVWLRRVHEEHLA
jgi:uncharacterized membrane protein